MMSHYARERRGRILAIEPDLHAGAALHRALASRVSADLVVVTNIRDALDAIAHRPPDLILTSTFLAPADEVLLSAHLRQCERTAHTQVIALPQFVETSELGLESTAAASIVLRLLRKPSPRLAARCDLDTLGRQIEEYLEQAYAARLSGRDHQRPAVPRLPGTRNPLEYVWVPPPASTELVLARRDDSCVAASEFRLPSDRRRAARRKGAELGLLRIEVPGEVEGSVVDISPYGVLIESCSPLSPGRLVQLQLRGADQLISVAARLIRSDTASNATYRTAAAFTREIDLLALCPGSPTEPIRPPAPNVLADLLGRVLADATWTTDEATLCARFEEQLAQLLRVQDLRIRSTFIEARSGCESVCVKIPGERAIVLQAIFEPQHPPGSVERRILKAAASLAGAVLDVAADESD